jgi:fructan beta-fructosidase
MSLLQGGERYRPQYHFTPERNWMNDPNGLVYFEGLYHLFYQYHPDGTTWGPMHWGHAVSPDLVRWEQQPIALEPDANGTIFSGSAVVDWNDTTGFFDGGSGLVAIFTHHLAAGGSGGSDTVRQRQSLAYSKDAGRTWIKYEGNPVLEDERQPDFRDPKVIWHAPSGRWVMALAVRDHIRFYTSPNLIDWTLGSEFGAGLGSHDGVWECPDLFELAVDGNAARKKWVLIVSIGSTEELAEGSRTQYFIGEFDGRTFHAQQQPDEVLWLDYGRDNYAGVSWSDIAEQDGRRIYIGWMSNWKYANLTPSAAWRGAMTLPRALTLKSEPEGMRLFQQPVDELQTLRRSEREWKELLIGEADTNLLAELSINAFEIVAEFEGSTADTFGFKVHTGPGQATVIGYDFTAGQLFIDRTASGDTSFQRDFACKHSAALLPDHGKIELRLLVDRSSVELFAQGGKVAMTDLIFPDPSGKGLELFVTGGSIRIIQLKLYEF